MGRLARSAFLIAKPTDKSGEYGVNKAGSPSGRTSSARPTRADRVAATTAYTEAIVRPIAVSVGTAASSVGSYSIRSSSTSLHAGTVRRDARRGLPGHRPRRL